MRGFMVVAIPIAAIALFIFIMISGTWLKNLPWQGKNIPDIIDDIKISILTERWDDSEEGIMELENRWNRVLKYIQFSVERDEVNFFNSSLARMKGAVLARDKAGSLMELHEALNHFNSLGN